MKKWIGGVLVLALVGVANGSDDVSHRQPVREAASSAAQAPPQVEREPVVERSRHRTKPRSRRQRPALVACDANIRVRATTTTCAFAQNVFYEYWTAEQEGEEGPIDAYSPATGRSYSLSCRGVTRVACRAGDGGYVTFPRTAVAAYDGAQATRYACSHDVGPDSAGCAPDGVVGDEAAGDGCDPNYSGACLNPASPDYDCEGGSGDGPDYTGEVEVVGDDPYDLDRDGDGVACDDSASSYGDDVYDAGEDSYAPTTEDFGSGSGSVGRCADGTLSDSIGRPGACSHHGGVG